MSEQHKPLMKVEREALRERLEKNPERHPHSTTAVVSRSAVLRLLADYERAIRLLKTWSDSEYEAVSAPADETREFLEATS